MEKIRRGTVFCMQLVYLYNLLILIACSRSIMVEGEKASLEGMLLCSVKTDGTCSPG